jgi:hypothetical protein
MTSVHLLEIGDSQVRVVSRALLNSLMRCFRFDSASLFTSLQARSYHPPYPYEFPSIPTNISTMSSKTAPKEAAASPIKLVSLPCRRLELVYDCFETERSKESFFAFHVCIDTGIGGGIGILVSFVSRQPCMDFGKLLSLNVPY